MAILLPLMEKKTLSERKIEIVTAKGNEKMVVIPR